MVNGSPAPSNEAPAPTVCFVTLDIYDRRLWPALELACVVCGDAEFANLIRDALRAAGWRKGNGHG